MRRRKRKPEPEFNITFTTAMAEAVPAYKQTLSTWTSLNVTTYIPSGRDLILASPRILKQLKRLPASVQHVLRSGFGGAIFAEATNTNNPQDVMSARLPPQLLAPNMTRTSMDLRSALTMESARSLSSVIAYTTSKWALGSLVMAIVTSRIRIYASTRRSVALSFKARLAIRIIPIVVLFFQIRVLLQSMQCQTSNDYKAIRPLASNSTSLNDLSKIFLFQPTDLESCYAVNMINEDMHQAAGSLSVLWPMYKTFGLSTLVQSLSYAIEGRHFLPDTGLSMFEHSLAFSEAEVAVGTDLGRIFDGLRLMNLAGNFSDSSTTAEATKLALNRSQIMHKVNTTPEMLLFVFLSACNHWMNHVLALFNLQNRYRLINTGVWGILYLAIIIGSILRFSLDDTPDQSLLRFPTVYLVGLLPHVMVMCGIAVCTLVYTAAVLLVAVSSKDDSGRRLSFRETLEIANENMQIRSSLAGIRIRLHQDFFTALLRTGFTLVSIGTEAMFLIEHKAISVQQRTWLENKRLENLPLDHVNLLANKRDTSDAPRGQAPPSNGYTNEITVSDVGKRNEMGSIGGNPSRLMMALQFIFKLNILMCRLLLASWTTMLSYLGLRVPTWMSTFLGRQSNYKDPAELVTTDRLQRTLGHRDMIQQPSEARINFDQHSTKALKVRGQSAWEEEEVNDAIYNLWKSGGTVSGMDDSSDYHDSGDEDLTSMVSTSTFYNSEDDAKAPSSLQGAQYETHVSWLKEGFPQLSHGAIRQLLQQCEGDFEKAYTKLERNDDWSDDDVPTPTNRSPRGSRASTPTDTLLTTANLAQLLSPSTVEQRVEAETLAAHLSSDRILTRSAYRRYNALKQARVTLPPRLMTLSYKVRLSAEEEEQMLEYLILAKRSHLGRTSVGGPTTWREGAEGMGEGGPQCVVCQSSPRSIIIWPCRCLCVCDACRVSLAMGNFEKCVCCRSSVEGFSRIFVP